MEDKSNYKILSRYSRPSASLFHDHNFHNINNIYATDKLVYVLIQEQATSKMFPRHVFAKFPYPFIENKKCTAFSVF